MSFNHMFPSFDLKKSFDPILCVFSGKIKENSRRVKEKARNKEEKEESVQQVAQIKGVSLKPKHARPS